MPLLQVTNERPDDEIRDLVRASIVSAEQEFSPLKFEGEYPTSGFGIAIIRPRDVGIANDFWQFTVTTAYANWINDTLGTDNFVLITGLFNNTIDPQTSEIQPSANGQDLPCQNIEQLYSMENRLAWFTKPFAVRPSNQIRIQAVGRNAGTERLGLEGWKLGKRSQLIDQTP